MDRFYVLAYFNLFSDDDYTPSEYKFKCEACGKSFMTEMMLKYHGCEAKKEEEEDNGFDCPECGKKYWSQKMLDIHKKVSNRLCILGKLGDIQ